MKNSLGKELRVGALIAIGLLIIFMAFFAIGGQEGIFSKTYELYAKFENVEGLTNGAAVRLGGVKVGTVRHIGFVPNGVDKNVVVTLSINADSFDLIRKDSNARLGSQGLLGDRTVEISVGSPYEPKLEEEDFISSVEAAQLSDLISESGDAMTDIKITAQNAKEITWKINHGSGSMAQILNDPRLYTNLDSLLNLWTVITVKINKGEGFLAKILNDPALYANLSSSLDEFQTLLANINKGQGSLGKLATEDAVYNRMDSILTNLDNTLAKINSGDGTAGQLLNNAEMYVKFSTTMDELNTLIADIRENPKKYVKFSLF